MPSWKCSVSCLPVFLGVMIHRHYVPVVTTVQTNEHTTTKYVNVPTLDEKTITKIISDPKDKAAINALVAENKALNLRITSLTDTVATLDSRGSGIIVAEQPPGAPINYHFEDYRLKFNTDLKTANYALSQKFVVMTTTATGTNGKPVTLVNVYEEGPHGERTPVPAQTTALFATGGSHWFTKLNVQAGVGFTKDAASQGLTGGVVGLQWLKRGVTNAPGDVRWAVLTPVLFAAAGVKEPGLLPLSFNLGSLPYQPFSNFWLSPYIGVNPVTRGVSRLGIVFTATF
jgi:hypothetical protein